MALLAEAGYPGGKGLPKLTVALPDNPSNDQFVETFRQAWKVIGLEVDHVVVKGNYYDQLATLDHTIGYFSWIGDFLDPVTFLVLWKGGSSLNSFSYSDAGLRRPSDESGNPKTRRAAQNPRRSRDIAVAGRIVDSPEPHAGIQSDRPRRNRRMVSKSSGHPPL